MPRETLRFVQTDRPPATDGIRVFDALERSFLGAAFTFRIIGSSHYISAPAYDFYELAACDGAPTEVGNGTETEPGTETASRDGAAIPLEADRPSRRLAFETASLRCETTVDHRPLSAFPHGRFRSRPDSFDLAHAFGGDPEAATTIEIDDRGYETYHTYPEYDLALYTRTVFTAVPDSSDDESGDAATAESDANAASTRRSAAPPATDGPRETPNTF